MDPSSMDPPTTIEPTFNSARLVNPTSNNTPLDPPSPAATPTHPSYAEMITAAITALKEKDGSSRIAIAKYIDRVYANLPPNHSALLTQHLKRLKNSGYLVMVKHSYMLAGSAPPPPAFDSNGTDVSSVAKRKPGRPPKPKVEAQFQAHFQPTLQTQTQPQFLQPQPQYLPHPQFQVQPQMQFGGELQFTQPQAYATAPQAQFLTQPLAYDVSQAQNYAGLGAESVFVSLGLADGPVGVSAPAPTPAVSLPPAPGADASTTKRRPGRPRKDGSTVFKPAEPMLPDQSGLKRRPGRPPTSGAVSATGSTLGPKPRGRPRKNAAAGRRGRPKKNVATATANGANATNIPAGGGPVPTPKRRGRPPKSPVAAAVGVTDVPIAAAFDTGNLPNTVDGATNGALLLGKRRGRPPRSYTAVAAAVKKPRKLSGKPLGRPRKNVASAAVSDPKLLVAYEELKGKLEHLQSRIKETANVLKPCLNAEMAGNALAALQELEELAAAGVEPVQQN